MGGSKESPGNLRNHPGHTQFTARRASMSEMPLAMLVTDRPIWGSELKAMLESRGFAVYVASNCAEATLLLHSYTPPHLVFTDMQLVDGSWAGILSLAEKTPLAVNVIVVSRNVDIDSYVQVLERGAFDFIVPPFEVSEIDHIVRCAFGNTLVRRQLQRKSETAGSLREGRKDNPFPVDDDFEMAPSL
jgi:DNA-binding NtrC family response regulator